MRPPGNDERGFTLIEILIVIAIAGILVGFTYSGFQGVTQRQRCRAAVNRIVSFLKEAQALAREKRTACYIVSYTSATDGGNGTIRMKLDTTYANAAYSTAYNGTLIYRELKLSRVYQGVTVQTAATFRYDYRGTPGAGTFPVTLSFQNARKSSEIATITVSSMGEIGVSLPAAWKR